MTTDPRHDVVVEQYERWVYPEPIQDLPQWLEQNWQWFDPSHAHRLLWPERPYRPGLDVLIAGCGTNQAAVIAFTNPSAHVVAIDVSAPSLRHQELLRERYDLRNLELHLLPIEDVSSLGRDFDLIMSTGVLHHLADPQVGMNALADCLREDGVLALMLYARYGRIGVEIMESVFSDVKLSQDEASLALVHQALAYLPADHPVRSYLALAPDLSFDAGLVDTFLHGRERSYTVEECLELVDNSGLVFQDWFFKSLYEPPRNSGNAFFDVVSVLPDDQRWSVMERLHTRNGCHFFTACRRQRPLESYHIDLHSQNFDSYVPSFRYRCGVNEGMILRPGWSVALSGASWEVVRRIDGEKTIHQLAHESSVDLETTRDIIESLWEQDFLAIGLSQSS